MLRAAGFDEREANAIAAGVGPPSANTRAMILQRIQSSVAADFNFNSSPAKVDAEVNRRFGVLMEALGQPAQGAGAPPQTAAPARAPTPAAIEHLRRNPNLAPDFDRKFGPGAAARALGQ